VAPRALGTGTVSASWRRDPDAGARWPHGGLVRRSLRQPRPWRDRLPERFVDLDLDRRRIRVRRARGVWMRRRPPALEPAQMQARGSGRETKWYTMGIWASGDGDIHRTSVGGQGDADGFIAIDTFIRDKKAEELDSYRAPRDALSRERRATRACAGRRDDLRRPTYASRGLRRDGPPQTRCPRIRRRRTGASFRV